MICWRSTGLAHRSGGRTGNVGSLIRRRTPECFLVLALAATAAIVTPTADADAKVAAPTDGHVYLPLALAGVDISALPRPATVGPPTASPTVPRPKPSPTRTAPAGPDIATEHYDLHVEVVDATDVGRMLEELHKALSAFFGRQPTGRLRGGLYATLEGMKAALAADGETYHGGGGYYSPSTRAFYLFVQPSEYFTRQLCLHEATHQFHLLSASGDRQPSGFWYVEGIAEHFGMHNWDGERLATGVVPAISLEDYPAQALTNFDAQGGDLADLIAEGAEWRRPDGWGLVSFLVDRRAPTYRDLFARLDRGESPTSAWDAVFGPVTPDVTSEYRAWLLDHQQPWREVWRSWQERGDVLEGESGVVSIAVLKAIPTRLAAELIPVEGAIGAGLVFGYQSADDFYMLQLRANRDVWIVRRLAGAWHFLASSRAAPVAGHDVVALDVRGDEVTPSVNGVATDAGVAPGLVGLNVEGGNVRFRVSVEP